MGTTWALVMASTRRFAASAASRIAALIEAPLLLGLAVGLAVDRVAADGLVAVGLADDGLALAADFPVGLAAFVTRPGVNPGLGAGVDGVKGGLSG